ncbi:MAG: MBL fold metallo-hydrolase, partial [Deltaproteobacteria bacterium]|nr:MBL fold metallo-hydrolase [Deltaproteobacteria bacterium]
KGDYKVRSIRDAGIEPEDVKRIIMTHTHLDHIGCFKEIKQEMPWLELWVHEVEAAPLEGGDERTVYGMDMFKAMVVAQYNLKPGDFTFKVDRMLKEGDQLDLGGMTWEVLHVPGHSAGSIALYEPKDKILIPGDTVYADFAIGRFDLHGADAAALKNSLLRLADLEVEILLPGHNRIMKDVPGGYIAETARQWEAYLV